MGYQCESFAVTKGGQHTPPRRVTAMTGFIRSATLASRVLACAGRVPANVSARPRNGADSARPRIEPFALVGVRFYAHTIGRIFWQFIGVPLLVGFVGAYFWWIIAKVAVRGGMASCSRVSRGAGRGIGGRPSSRRDGRPRRPATPVGATEGDDKGVYGPAGARTDAGRSPLAHCRRRPSTAWATALPRAMTVNWPTRWPISSPTRAAETITGMTVTVDGCLPACPPRRTDSMRRSPHCSMNARKWSAGPFSPGQRWGDKCRVYRDGPATTVQGALVNCTSR